MGFEKGENKCIYCKHHGYQYAKRFRARVGYCKAKECRFEMRDKKKQGAVMITDKGE